MRINFKNTSYLFSFKSKNQLAFFEIIKEYYIDKQLDFAEIIFQIKGKEYKQMLEGMQERINKLWNPIFEMERTVKGKRIIVGQQNFKDSTILIKDNKENVLCCQMYQDESGEIYFIYNNTGVYISEYMGEFEIA